MDIRDYENAIEQLNASANDFPNIVEAVRFSRSQIDKARRVLADLKIEDGAAIAALAVGSIGRLEALEASDIDLDLVFDPDRTTREIAVAGRKAMIERLESVGFEDVSSKTFKDPMDMRQLLYDVGGNGDTNLNLTNRALMLTEVAWFYNPSEVKHLTDRILSVYQEGLATRGRFLTSLSNDLHRYYRTLCVDYRYKVEEVEKEWAIRNMKLRHSRKLWHLSNLTLQCAASDMPQDDHDGFLGGHLGDPPLMKLLKGLSRHNGEELGGRVWTVYDRFLGLIGDQAFRDALNEVKYSTREESSDFQTIHENAVAFDEAAQAVVEHLWQHYRPYFIRFWVL